MAKKALFWLALLLLALAAQAKEAPAASDDPALESRMVSITSELRCLVCQNQTIADSHADLAVDLRRQVREMLAKGASDKEITDYMTARYGDFVLYRPPVKGTTALLWFGPPTLLLVGLVLLYMVLRRRSRMSADQFEPDEDADGDIAMRSPNT
jgi:cytochrome c-type biogenesis protein CcmH